MPWEIWATLFIAAVLTLIAYPLTGIPIIGLISSLLWITCALTIADLSWSNGATWIMGYPFIYLLGLIGLLTLGTVVYGIIFPKDDGKIFVEYGGDDEY